MTEAAGPLQKAHREGAAMVACATVINMWKKRKKRRRGRPSVLPRWRGLFLCYVCI